MNGIPFLKKRSRGLPSQTENGGARLWMDMYRGLSPAAQYPDRSLSLPTVIASELARIATIEAELKVTGEGGAFIAPLLGSLGRNLRRYTEYACAGGGAALLPVFGVGVGVGAGVAIDAEGGDGISAECVTAENILSCRFTPSGRAIEMSLARRQVYQGKNYLRIENFTLDGADCVITNRAWRTPFADAEAVLSPSGLLYGGEAVPLGTVPEWEGIEPRAVLKNVGRLPVAYFRMPQGNSFDPSSQLGASVFARAVGLIREADAQFGRLIWEFEGGELALDVSEDLFRRTRQGLALPVGKERLFRPNLLDTASTEVMRTFAPELRDASYINGLDIILKQIEDVCGLARGTVSSLKYEERTATEIRDSKQRMYATVRDIQKSLDAAIRDLVKAAVAIGKCRGQCPDITPEIYINFNDSIVEDAAAERTRDLEEVKSGVMLPSEFRAKWIGDGGTVAF